MHSHHPYLDPSFSEGEEISFGRRVLGDIRSVYAALKLEPAIRPSFAKANIVTVVRIMFAAMMNHSFDAAGIYRYLEARDCIFDRETIDYLLNSYEGEDTSRHLWSRGSLGEYEPLSEIIGA